MENPTAGDLQRAEEEFKKPVLEQYERESSTYFATARLWDDGILDPVNTRQALALAFATTLNAPLPLDRFGTFRM
jgi:3-methylcrotonyl-CoA carboxylase beta subunit